MWWQVVLKVSCLVAVVAAQVVNDPIVGAATATGMNCVDYTNERLAKMIREGWRTRTPLIRKLTRRSAPDLPTRFVLNMQPMARRMDSISIIDNLIPRGDYLVKEHAKLVHDINSLRQVVFVKPFAEENKDYDDSIFHEIIETSTTYFPASSSFRPLTSSTRVPVSTSTKESSIPVILVGGASQTQRQVVKSQPISFVKPTVSLVGTTISPLIKHPYPFVMHRKPVKICVTSLPPMLTTPFPSKTLWERLLDYFIPRRSLGR